MNLFIDTNILLNFYHFSSDDLEELNKLLVLLRSGELVLYVPQQVIDEFYRNRDNKIADALKEFRKEKIDRPFPQMTKQYPQYQVLRDLIKSFDENRQTLLEALLSDINKNSLKADQLIAELLKNGTLVHITPEIYSRAKRRHELGNPPGKKDSIGDAINWEALIEIIPAHEDLYFISEDSDYFSELNSEQLKPFLGSEWRMKKRSAIETFKSLAAFFKKCFPKIKLATEYERQLLIEKLATSESYANTKTTLYKLATLTDFSVPELHDIISACLNNNQIYWIASDYSVRENLKRIILPHKKLIDPELYATFENIYSIEKDFSIFSVDHDDLPF